VGEEGKTRKKKKTEAITEGDKREDQREKEKKVEERRRSFLPFLKGKQESLPVAQRLDHRQVW